jgi:hypothetical protein
MSMLKNLDFKKTLPYIVAIVLFLVISYAYFSPLLEGKRLEQHDFKTYKGGAKEITDYREETGEEALWTNSMFGGMPAYLISTRFKGNLLQYVNKALQIGPRPGSYLFILLLGSYLLFLSLKINPWLSIVGAIAMAFSSYNFIIILAGHNTKVVAIAYIAPVLAGIFLTFRGKKLLGSAITGVFFSLQILAGHPQITYYTLIIILVFGIAQLWMAIKEKAIVNLLTSVGMLTVAVGLAVLSNYSRLATTLEYDDHSMRSKSELTENEEDKTEGLTLSYATQWSYGVDETLTLMIPGFKGGSSTYALSEESDTYNALAQLDRNFAGQFVQNANMYWGSQASTSGPVYLGAVIMFLFVLGMFIVDKKYKWWIFSAAVLGIMLSWGRNFMPLTEFFMHNIPGYNKFRTVSMTLVIPQIVIPILALLAANKVLFGQIEKKKFLRSLQWSVGITGGLSLLFILIPSLAGNFSSPIDMQIVDSLSRGNEQLRQFLVQNLIPALESDRQQMLRTDALRTLVFILLVAGLLYAYYLKKIKVSLSVVIVLLGLLVIVDMWSVNKRFLNNDQFVNRKNIEQPYQPTVADQAILQSPGKNERVLNLTVSTFNDASTSYFHPSIGGYHGAKMRRYQDLISTSISEEMTMLIHAMQSQDLGQIDSTLKILNVLNMLNTKYIIINPNSAPLTNSFACGNAWFINDLVLAEYADDELLKLNDIDIRSQATLDRRFEEKVDQMSFSEDPSARIELTDYLPNRMTYASSSSEKQFAVFSEIYYEEGWEASIDGQPAEIVRVNYTLRGLEVPAGDHTIVFEFKPTTYFTGEKISYAGSILLILLLIGAAILELRKSKKTAVAQ